MAHHQTEPIMDVERLTPYLRRRVMRLPVEERVVLHREILASLESPELVQTDARLSRLAEVMEAVSGCDVKEKTRQAEFIRARVVFIFVARAEGFSQCAIGAFLGLDHSTVHYLERKMRDALAMPAAFQDYIALYNQFTTAIL